MADQVTMMLSIGDGFVNTYEEHYHVAPDGTVTMEVTEYEYHGREYPLQVIHEHKEHNICLQNTNSATSPHNN